MSTEQNTSDAFILQDFLLHNTRVPRFIYGTAWKEEATGELALKALNKGFSGIDTANQRKHYYEAGVGEALKRFYQSSGRQRSDLYLQTKFTYQEGQDERLPYDPNAPITQQVEQSFASSLEHLGTDYLDAYLLHGPSQREGLGEADFDVWKTMESFYRSGHIKLLGVCNVSADQLEFLNQQVAIKPMLVQNRCYAHTGWDSHVREVCRRHDIHYQGFSLLTANQHITQAPAFREIARRAGLTDAQVIFQACLRMNMIILTGTQSDEHMAQDLNCHTTTLSDNEVETIEKIFLNQQ
ncbi:MAG: aldo/keto reductase family protein [Endozoicomonas sp.]